MNPPPPRWADDTDLAARLRRLEAENHRLRTGITALCTEADTRAHLPTGGLVSARRLRHLLHP